jgi:hypothetical protein
MNDNPVQADASHSSATLSPEDALFLREARRGYSKYVKPALLTGLRAALPNALVDERTGYVLDVQDNLIGITLNSIASSFAAGAGNELQGKMRAPWSSSALAVNTFARWSAPTDLPLLHVAGESGFTELAFERKCPNGVSSIPPHLDVVLTSETAVVAIESKFTEYLQGATHTPVSTSYLRLAERGDPRASSKWFAALKRCDAFLVLDAYQLVKHYLGLRNIFGDDRCPLTLAYLYWEPAQPLNSSVAKVIERHRAEIARFTILVAGDPTCRFVSLTYGELWETFATLPEKPTWLVNQLKALRVRYLVSV